MKIIFQDLKSYFLLAKTQKTQMTQNSKLIILDCFVIVMLSYVFINNIPIKEPATFFSSVNPHSESLCSDNQIPVNLYRRSRKSKVSLPYTLRFLLFLEPFTKQIKQIYVKSREDMRGAASLGEIRQTLSPSYMHTASSVWEGKIFPGRFIFQKIIFHLTSIGKMSRNFFLAWRVGQWYIRHPLDYLYILQWLSSHIRSCP